MSEAEQASPISQSTTGIPLSRDLAMARKEVSLPPTTTTTNGICFLSEIKKSIFKNYDHYLCGYDDKTLNLLDVVSHQHGFWNEFMIYRKYCQDKHCLAMQ